MKPWSALFENDDIHEINGRCSKQTCLIREISQTHSMEMILNKKYLDFFIMTHGGDFF